LLATVCAYHTALARTHVKERRRRTRSKKKE
jgi:hypothetical protein